MKAALGAEGAMAEVIARFAGTIKGEGGQSISVESRPQCAVGCVRRRLRSRRPRKRRGPQGVSIGHRFRQRAIRHYKPIAAAGEGADLLAAAGIEAAQDAGEVSSKLGVVSAAGRDANAVAKAFIQAIAMHRHFDRKLDNG